MALLISEALLRHSTCMLLFSWAQKCEPKKFGTSILPVPQHVANDEAVGWRADIVLWLQLGQDVDALHVDSMPAQLALQLVEALAQAQRCTIRTNSVWHTCASSAGLSNSWAARRKKRRDHSVLWTSMIWESIAGGSAKTMWTHGEPTCISNAHFHTASQLHAEFHAPQASPFMILSSLPRSTRSWPLAV